MSFQIPLKDENLTQKLGAKIAAFSKVGDCFALFGDLGAGKTTFSRGFIQYLAGEEIDVPSPTFTILQTYDFDDYELWHFDLYRIENNNEIWELGWEDLPNFISLIEWPQRAHEYLPPNRIEIDIKFNAAARIANINIFGNGDFVQNWQYNIESLINEFV